MNGYIIDTWHFCAVSRVSLVVVLETGVGSHVILEHLEVAYGRALITVFKRPVNSRAFMS